MLLPPEDNKSLLEFYHEMIVMARHHLIKLDVLHGNPHVELYTQTMFLLFKSIGLEFKAYEILLFSYVKNML